MSRQKAETGISKWGDVPLWGNQVYPGQHSQGTASFLRTNRQALHERFREGNHVVGVLTLRCGLVHLCSLRENDGRKRRTCREFHHYDGLEQRNNDNRSVVMIAVCEGTERRQIQQTHRSMLLFDSVWQFKVRNLRSDISINLFWAKRGDELNESDYVFIGKATFTAMALMEEQNAAGYRLGERLHDMPVKSFENFFRRRPHASKSFQKLRGSQRHWAESLTWHDLRHCEQMIGRIGIQSYFDDGLFHDRILNCFSNSYGSWEEESPGSFIFVGNGLPPRRPDKRRTIPEAFAKMFTYLSRIRTTVTFVANTMNAAAAVQSWSHWPTSLAWFILLTIWSWYFRLDQLPQHCLLISIGFLFKTYCDRSRGLVYSQELSGSFSGSHEVGKAAPRVDRHIGNIKISVLSGYLPSKVAETLLHVQVAYLPGVGGCGEEKGGADEENPGSANQIMFHVGSVDEVERAKTSLCWHYFSTHGRTCSLRQQLTEMLSSTAKTVGSLQNRTLIWKMQDREHWSSDEPLEALEYAVLQSTKKYEQERHAIPWKNHTGRLVFSVRRRPTLQDVWTVGTAEVFIRDLVDDGLGTQPLREMRLPIRHAGEYDPTGDLNILIQIDLPDKPNHYGSIDRLKQAELESILSTQCIGYHPSKKPWPWTIRPWIKTKTDMANRNLQWLAYWGDDLYSTQSLVRWAHPWKTGSLLFVCLVLLLLVDIFPFHRLLFAFVVLSFAEGFYSKYKWKFRKDKKPSKVTVSIYGMKLKCSRTSSLHRLRNLMNSLPNDRDASEFFEPRRRVVQARDEFVKHSYAHLRGDLWSGPLLFKWKKREWSLRPRAILLNARAYSDMTYDPRYVVISPGFLRLFSGGYFDKEASHKTADGYDELKACGGWVKLRGNCTTLRIDKATVSPWVTRRGVPCVILDECSEKDCASWKLSLCCFDWTLRLELIRVLCEAGCIETQPLHR